MSASTRAADAAEAQRIVLGLIPDEYAFPLEDARAHAAHGIHSGVNKVLTVNREITPGRITVVFVDEVLGF